MNTHDIGIGTKLELRRISSSEDKTERVYVSQVMEIIDEENFLLACPIIKSKYVFFDTDTDIEIVFLDRSKSLYSLTAKIVSKEKVDSILVLKANIISDFIKIQRRMFYRLECCIEAKYSFNGSSEWSERFFEMLSSQAEPKKALTKNISGNGACIITDEKIPQGTVIDIELELGREEKFKIRSEVVRNNRIEGIPVEKYETGLFFADIPPVHQERVVRFIHDKQRSLLNGHQLF